MIDNVIKYVYSECLGAPIYIIKCIQSNLNVSMLKCD